MIPIISILLLYADPFTHWMFLMILFALPLGAMIRKIHISTFMFWFGLYFLFRTEYFEGVHRMNGRELHHLYGLDNKLIPCYMIGIVTWYIVERNRRDKKKREAE